MKTGRLSLTLLLFLSFPVDASPQMELLPLATDTVALSLYTPIKERTGLNDCSDTVFTDSMQLKKATQRFFRLLSKSRSRTSTANLFSAFYRYKRRNGVFKDSSAYAWYCRKWRNKAVGAKTDFLRMCYSDCFYEVDEHGPSVTPVVKINSDTVHWGLCFRDETGRAKMWWELSRLSVSKQYQKLGFKPLAKGVRIVDTVHWKDSLLLADDGLYRLLVYTYDNYYVKYFTIGKSVQALAHCDNRSIMVKGCPAAGEKNMPYTVSFISKGKAACTSTDSAGLCALTFKGTTDSLVNIRGFVERNGCIASLLINQKVIDQHNKLTAYIYSDRTWYRPGDTVHIGGIIKNYTDGTYFSPCSIDSVQIVLATSRTDKLEKRTVPVDSMGHFFTTEILERDAPLETYTVTIGPPAQFSGLFPEKISAYFEVAEFKKPSCKVFLTSNQKVYQPGENIDYKIQARYFLGAPVRYAYSRTYLDFHGYTLDTINRGQNPFRYRYLPEKAMNLPIGERKEDVLDKNGELTETIERDPYYQNGFYTLSSCVQGHDKRWYGAKNEMFIVADTPLVNVFRKYSCTRKGYTLHLSCYVTNVDGQPVNAAVICTLNTIKDTFIQEGLTDSRGVVRMIFDSIGTKCAQDAHFTVKTASGTVRKITVSVSVKHKNRLADYKMNIITDKPVYAHGDTALVSVHCPQDSVWLLFVVSSVTMKKSLSVEPDGNKWHEFRVPIDNEVGSVLFITAAASKNGYFKTAHKQIVMETDSTILLNVDSDALRRYEPGSRCTLHFTITDRENNPVTSQFTAAVVDEGVFSIIPEKDSGMVYNLIPRSYRYPCSTFTSNKLNVREQLRIFQSLSLLLQASGKQTKKIDPYFNPYDSLTYTKNMRYEMMARMYSWMCCKVCRRGVAGIGYGAGYGSGFGGLAGGLMGGDGGGGLNLKKRGSRRIRLPQFTKGGALNARPKIRRYFRDQAIWFPVVHSSDKGKAKISFDLPDNLTQWRIRLRGSDGKRYLIDYKDSITTNKPIMIQLETPQFLISHDSSIVHTVIFNENDQKCTAEVSFIVDEQSGGNDTLFQTLTLSPKDIRTVEWPLVITGSDSITVTGAVRTPLGSDAERRTIPVSGNWFERRTGRSILLRDSATLSIDFPAKALPWNRKCIITIAGNQIEALLPTLYYLMQFPHGCVEQTMSRFLPDLYVARALKEHGIKNDSLETLFKKYLDEGITRLERYQHEDGGWGWWKSGKSKTSMTGLVMRGLITALNVSIDSDARNRIQKMVDRGLLCINDYIDSCVNDTGTVIRLLNSIAELKEIGHYEKLIKAYAENAENLSTLECACLLECCYILKMKKHERKLIDLLEKRLIIDDKEIQWDKSISRYNRQDWTGTDIYLTAVVLHSIALVKPDHPLIQPLLDWLYSKNDGVKWITTATTAEVIKAISTTFRPTKKNYKKQPITVTVNHRTVKTSYMDKHRKVSMEIPDTLLTKSDTITIKSADNNPLFCFLKQYYTVFPENSTGDSLRSLVMERSYSRKELIDGKEWKSFPIRNNCLSGDEIEATLKIRSRMKRSYIMIEENLPAGIELIIPADCAPPEGATHCEYHPDKLILFFDNLEKGETLIKYRFRAIFPGEYQVRPAYAESMYIPQINGYSRACRFRIKK